MTGCVFLRALRGPPINVSFPLDSFFDTAKRPPSKVMSDPYAETFLAFNLPFLAHPAANMAKNASANGWLLKKGILLCDFKGKLSEVPFWFWVPPPPNFKGAIAQFLEQGKHVNMVGRAKLGPLKTGDILACHPRRLAAWAAA